MWRLICNWGFPYSNNCCRKMLLFYQKVKGVINRGSFIAYGLFYLFICYSSGRMLSSDCYLLGSIYYYYYYYYYPPTTGILLLLVSSCHHNGKYFQGKNLFWCVSCKTQNCSWTLHRYSLEFCHFLQNLWLVILTNRSCQLPSQRVSDIHVIYKYTHTCTYTSYIYKLLTYEIFLFYFFWNTKQGHLSLL